ncbi:uncharacterized protein LOC124201908 [Daphnia pulex]|uniref:uncharacterized protein LOC124201908 n=1 Tax=Daphnia pulex TaxID=6669 RepID=UPI001EDDD711|nr:uncharacterized protein LOC124201908 [Daphnia pulex]XP_046454116.1 uncharacterized protein LOC124201908 [Daphnia pulex]
MVDWIPVLSQVKSLVQLACKDPVGAEETQKNFVTQCPGLAHVVGGVAVGLGLLTKNDGMTKFGMKALKGGTQTVGDLVDAIPVVGHLKGVIHLTAGDDDGATRALNAANRTSVAMTGTGVLLSAGPFAAFMVTPLATIVYGGVTSLVKGELPGKRGKNNKMDRCFVCQSRDHEICYVATDHVTSPVDISEGSSNSLLQSMDAEEPYTAENFYTKEHSLLRDAESTISAS